jgi:hypothetical protein
LLSRAVAVAVAVNYEFHDQKPPVFRKRALKMVPQKALDMTEELEWRGINVSKRSAEQAPSTIPTAVTKANQYY